ncbi:hypothetical protein EVAR_64893_1 [Eumeta japonica]|uniref:Uncharacterized protein n=1 Tax=Eumeta variegata TaxID=151549 RepID=A0A4C1ZVC7_EUMVA|nr:hypothetical protein EVAR_64893_1 [Eumeta japonica]
MIDGTGGLLIFCRLRFCVYCEVQKVLRHHLLQFSVNPIRSPLLLQWPSINYDTRLGGGGQRNGTMRDKEQVKSFVASNPKYQNEKRRYIGEQLTIVVREQPRPTRVSKALSASAGNEIPNAKGSGWGRGRGVWATGTLTGRNSGSCHFTSVSYGNVVFDQSSRSIFMLQPNSPQYGSTARLRGERGRCGRLTERLPAARDGRRRLGTTIFN